MRAVDQFHESYVERRRVRVLVDHLASLIPRDAHVLDVGCGDGHIAYELAQKRSDLRCEGIEVLVRPEAVIPVREFDGTDIPYPPDSFDVVLFVDVLHHCDRPEILLQAAARVARRHVIIKDHYLDGFLAGATLRFMDRISNKRKDVTMPYNYWPKERWDSAWNELGLRVEARIDDVGLYPWPASWIFGRSLHFVASLTTPNSPRSDLPDALPNNGAKA